MSTVGELAGAGWRIVFFREHDRIAHRIVSGDAQQPLIESLEGAADEDWPASPPLQQVHFQPGRGGGSAALLVGMAGRSHWSAAIELDGPGRLAVFEIACRVSGSPGWLGTSYRLTGPDTIGYSAGALRVGPIELPSPPSESNCLPWSVQQTILRLAVVPDAGAWPQTIRWGYTLRYEP